MANSFVTNPIVLDDFSAAINVASSAGWGTSPIFVKSIEWQTPTNTAHTCAITGTVGGTDYIFQEKCTTENQSIIKYYNTWVNNLCIAIAAGAHMASGKIVITL